MKDDELIEAMARAITDTIEAPLVAEHVWRAYIPKAKAALAVARPVIERETRERCAKVAEGFEANRDWVNGSLWGNIRREVAEEIRKLK